MNGSLIDTNIIIKLLNGDPNAIDIFSSAKNIFIPVTVVGELFYGAYKSTRVKENFDIFDNFLANYPILSIDKDIAIVYGEIKSKLIKKGFKLPENDIWIAAIAKTNQYTLLTFDSHFSQINGLNVKN